MNNLLINRRMVSAYLDPDSDVRETIRESSIAIRMLVSVMSVISLILDPVRFVLGCIYEAVIALVIIPFKKKWRFIKMTFGEYMPSSARLNFWTSLDTMMSCESDKLYCHAKKAAEIHSESQLKLIDFLDGLDNF